MQESISFDLAMVNYKTRTNSDLEQLKAKELALKFNKIIFTQIAPFFKSNFEKNARDFRYQFFEKICLENSYNNLILAHHLNDHFEWFLMQLSRGAGLAEILGMNECEKRKHYQIIRPLLFVAKNEILDFLKQKEIFYFKDESNADERYFRNSIRKNFADDFINKFSKGVKKSFFYLDEDKKKLYNLDLIEEFGELLICPKNESLIAKAVKMRGVLLSAAQRKQILKTDCVVSGKIGIVYKNNKAIIFEYEICEKLPKKFKEQCRIAKIPPLLRAYLYNHNINVLSFDF